MHLVGLKFTRHIVCSIYSPHMFLNDPKVFSEKSKYSNPSVLWILVVQIPYGPVNFRWNRNWSSPPHDLVNGLDHLQEAWENLHSEMEGMGRRKRKPVFVYLLCSKDMSSWMSAVSYTSTLSDDFLYATYTMGLPLTGANSWVIWTIPPPCSPNDYCTSLC